MIRERSTTSGFSKAKPRDGTRLGFPLSFTVHVITGTYPGPSCGSYDFAHSLRKLAARAVILIFFMLGLPKERSRCQKPGTEDRVQLDIGACISTVHLGID